MDLVYALRIFLVSVAIGGVVYACVGTGAFSREQANWWDGLSKHKKIAFGGGIAATLLQTFI